MLMAQTDGYNPELPPSPGATYTLTLKSVPENVCTFMVNDKQQTKGLCGAGNNYYISVYNIVRDYTFVRWLDEEGNEVTTSTAFNHVMPDHDVTLIAEFRQSADPYSPDVNFFDRETGTLHADFFAPGEAQKALGSIGYYDNDKLHSVIYAGPIADRDYRFSSSNFPNLYLLDYSRTAGGRNVPADAYNTVRNSINGIILPACVETIGNRAFAGCGALINLTCFALIPPTVDDDAFDAVSGDLVVYVPAEAVSAYKAHAVWGKHHIKPITADIHTLSVSFTDEHQYDLIKEHNCHIEATNVKSGQRLTYLVDERTTYDFHYLPTLTNWRLSLYYRDEVLGTLDGVAITDHDVSLTWGDLRRWQDYTATFTDPNDQDVTFLFSQSTELATHSMLAWVNTANGVMESRNTMAQLLEGDVYELRVVTMPPLLTDYCKVPPAVPINVTRTGDRLIQVVLAPQGKLTLQGRVLHADFKSALTGAEVVVEQNVNGVKRLMRKEADASGRFELPVFNAAPQSAHVSLLDYGTKKLTIPVEQFADDAVIDLGDIYLQPVPRTNVYVNYEFTPAVDKGMTSEVQEHGQPSDPVEFVVKSVTTGDVLTNVQQMFIGNLEIRDELKVGEKIEITVSSPSHEFEAVTITTTVDVGNTADATFPITECGGIKFTIGSTDNTAVVAMIYDAAGRLVGMHDFESATLTVPHLLPGQYHAVLMAENEHYNVFNQLSQLSEAGLVVGKDYALANVDVPRGIIVPVYTPSVPLFNSSPNGGGGLADFLDYAESYFSNRANNEVGSYATLYANVVFREEVRSKVSGVQLVIDVPEDAPYVEGSAMMAPIGAGSGDIVSGVQSVDGHIIIPIASPSATASTLARCCIRPSYATELTTTAYVRFNYAGKAYMQPLGRITFDSMDLAFTCDDVLNKEQFSITGVLNPTVYGPQAQIVVYDEDKEIGRADNTLGGGWVANCELDHPFTGSLHTLYVKVLQGDEVIAQSLPKIVQYEHDYNKVRMVTVNFFEESSGQNRYIHLDYERFTRPEPMTYNPMYPTSFAIDFSDNNPERIHDVMLYYFSGGWNKLPAEWNERKGCWVAVSKRGLQATRIAVEYNQDYKKYINAGRIAEVDEELARIQQNCRNFQHLAEAICNEDLTEDDYYERMRLLGEEYGIDLDFMHSPQYADLRDSSVSLEEFEAMLVAKYGSLEVFEASVAEAELDFAEAIDNLTKEANEVIGGFSFQSSTCEGLTEQQLLDMGCIVTEDPEGHKWFILDADNHIDMYCLELDTHYAFNRPEGHAASSPDEIRKRIELGDFQYYYGLMDSAFAAIKSTIDMFVKNVDAFVAKCDKQIGAALNVLYDNMQYAFHRAMKSDSMLDWISYKAAQKSYAIAHHAADGIKPLLKKVSKALPVVSWLNTIAGVVLTANKLRNALHSIVPCPGAMDEADLLGDELIGMMKTTALVSAAELVADITTDIVGYTSLLVLPETGGTSVIPLIASVVCKIVVPIGEFILDMYMSSKVDDLTEAARKLAPKCGKKYGPNAPNAPDSPTPEFDGPENQYPYPIPLLIDPSGYVFEAVTSNRVEGATASIYYKEEQDGEATPVFWDAENYGQENPLYTDADGRYRWDVPAGLWQVRIDKQGYAQTQSEWLPVPPPQLDVNLPLVSYREPRVVAAHAYDDGIELTFDTYMAAPSLTTERIGISSVAAGQATRLTDTAIRLLDEEDGFARRIFVSTDGDALTTADEAILTVDRRVQSYAGVMMAAPFSQRFDIEPRIKQLIAPDEHRLALDSVLTLKVAAVPAAAVAGRTLRLSVGSDEIAKLATEEVPFNADGEATFTLTADMYGTTALNYSISGTEFQQRAVIIVTGADALPAPAEIEVPTASRLSGTSVFRGQAVALHCATKGATIYYTTDGSCPCESTTRIKYDGRPIVINADLHLQAMAVAEDGTESATASFDYTIRQTTMRMAAAEGWNWASHTLATAVQPGSIFTGAESVAQRIITSEGESEWRDARWRGDAQQLLPAESFRLLTGGAASYVVSGDEYNYNSLISLPAGWTWLGYPVSQPMAPADALAYLTPDEGDCLVGQDGFIVYSDGAWQGTLSRLAPAEGYMYRSVAPKSLAYHVDAEAASRARTARWSAAHKAAPAAWTVDKRAFPHLMPVVASIYAGNACAEADYIAAFVGDECRGVAPVNADGVAFLSVYGNGGEALTFRAMTADGTVTDFANAETLRLDLLGTPVSPYLLLDEANMSIGHITAPTATDAPLYDLSGRRVTMPHHRGIYITPAGKVLR